MKRTVKDVMTTDVVAVRPSASYKEAVRRLRDFGVGAMPVVDDDERLVGVVTEADLLLKEEGAAAGKHHGAPGRRRRERRKAEAFTVRELMTSPVVTVVPGAALNEAARLLHERNIKQLPVVDASGALRGIVSRRDLVSVFLRPDADIRDEVVHDVVERSLALGPETLHVHVEDGVVTLEGRLETADLVKLVIEMVGRVDGVVGVNSRLSSDRHEGGVPSEVVLPWRVLPTGLRSSSERRRREQPRAAPSRAAHP